MEIEILQLLDGARRAKGLTVIIDVFRALTYKQEREFYRTAAAKILCDTPEITVIEYFDKTKSRIVIHVFTRIVQQTSLTIYPYIASGEYRYNDQTYSAEELRENGVTVGIGSNCGREIVLFKKDC